MKPKHHILISALLLGGLILLGYAKRAEIEESIRWHERVLNWEDFPVINSISGNFHAQVYSDIQFEGNRADKYLNIYAQMIPHKSGRINEADIESDQLLIHEQHHFNITEYYARLFRKEAIGIGIENLTNNELQRLGKKYLEAERLMQLQYDDESKHNTQWPAQRYWELYIDGLLRETANYSNQDLYSYQDFYKQDSPWFRKVYQSLEGELLTSYPENTINSMYGEVYNVVRKPDSTVILFYKNGTLVNGGYFEAAQTSITYSDNGSREVKRFDAEGSPFSNTTVAHITRTISDENGNITRTYFDENGNRVAKNGVYKLKGIWNAAEKSMYSSYFNKDGMPVKRFKAYHELREMGANKVTKIISSFSKGGKPMLDEFFIFKYVYESNDNFVVTNAKEFNMDGKLAIAVDRYNSTYEYNAQGNIIATAFFDDAGNKTTDVDGVHKYTYSYDIYGNLTDLRKFNIRGLPTKGMDDYHQHVSLYDSLGRITFDAKYYPGYVLKFSEKKDGATTYEYQGDSLVIKKNVDAFGIESANDLGVSKTQQFLNDKKEIISEAFFKADGNWAKTEDGVAKYHYKYDERGNQIEMSAFDSLGKLHAWQEDVAIVRWEYDKNNNKTKTTYFTVTDQLANAVENTTFNRYKYDANNYLIDRSNYDKNMNPSLIDGVFRTSVIVNRFGMDSIAKMYGTDNKLLAPAGMVKYTYNPRGLLLTESFFNQRNQPALNANGVHKIVYNRDKHDRFTGTEYYGTKGEKTTSFEGFSTMVVELNYAGFLRRYSYFGVRENPVIGPEGYHKLENFYNDNDEVVRSSIYGTDDKLMNNAEGIADYVYQIDSSGRTIRTSFYDADGNLTEDAQGIAEYIYSPAQNGLYYLEKQLTANGTEVALDDL
ncbi:hypothetical protein K8089_09910 [Aequorivita sp. F47161]|uniref:YD repeat-containing protein n=1 Tax=Aequorivita vitellina TaxID=2874475 RepID=A0A9X1QXS3_9FLAO|nr:hypothetical protein [Aequorivita vitellina]MCG2419337.1 hypothetical protein [Aequorivita vitellina]